MTAARDANPQLTAAVGDARDLPLPDGSVDATLLLGPLYHVIERADRVTALREAARVTRPGGPVIAAVISRNAALIGLTGQGRVDERTRPILLEAYATGVNDPETGFTTAYFHRPEQVVDEFTAAGLPTPRLYGVEGPLWPLLDVGPDDRLFRDAVACAEAFEQDPAVIGASSHLLAVASA